MSYPQYPGNQPSQHPQQYGYPEQYGSPQQPGYPQQPGQYPAPPPPVSPFPGGNDIQQQPSKGTAIAAGVLAILGAIWALIFAIANFVVLSNPGTVGDALKGIAWTQAIAYAIEVLTLGPGAILLFRRKDLGRWLVVAGSAVHIIQGIIGVVGVLSVASSSGSAGGSTIGGGIFGAVIVLAPAIATIILALLPPTGRWLNWNANQQQQGMPQ